VSGTKRVGHQTTSDAPATGPIRVGNGERQAASEVLSRHYADGRLTLEEFDQRVGAVWAARTRSDLAAVQHDLPRLADPEAGHRNRLASLALVLRQRTLPAVIATVVLGSLVLLLLLRLLLWAADGFGGDAHHDVG